MLENFDDTQFITFDIKENEEVVLEKIKNIFNSNGFTVIFEEELRNVKIDYFKPYRQDYFIELKDELFIGEFEDWESVEDVPDRIKLFEEQIKQLNSINEVYNIKIIITILAEMGHTSNTELMVEISDVLNGLFGMSDRNYDIWTDNLIISLC